MLNDNANINTCSATHKLPFSDYPELLAKPHNRLSVFNGQNRSELVGVTDFQRDGRLPERNTKYNENKAKWEAVLHAGATLSCTIGYIGGQCASGHQFLKVLYCGKEWCHNCGEDGSPAHQRRIARWIPKVMQMTSVGYLVITIPVKVREQFNDRKRLTHFRTFVKRKLQRLGYSRGLIRYHSFGDCEYCEGKGCARCRDTGAGTRYNPHLNILIDENYLDEIRWKQIILPLRQACTNYFRQHFGRIPKKDLIGNVFYSYAGEQAHIMHKLKYVTRSTFRVFNPKYAVTWTGFRTTSTWGNWDKPEAMPKNDLALLETGFCPVCAEAKKGKQPIKWFTGYHSVDTETGEIKWIRGIVSRKEFEFMGYHIKHIEAGYYSIVPEIECEGIARLAAFHFNQLELFRLKDENGFVIN